VARLIFLLVAIVSIGLISFQLAAPTKQVEQDRRAFEKSLKERALHIVTDVGMGSAIYLDKGLALTAGHVCEMFAKAKKVAALDYKKNNLRIEFYEMVKKEEIIVDLCLLKVSLIDSLPITSLAQEDSISIGTPLYNPNYGGGKYYSLTSGMILADAVLEVPVGECFPPFIPCTKFEAFAVQIASCPGIPGASGSGVLNTKGELIGILVIGMNYGTASGIVDLEAIKRFLNDSKLASLAQIYKK
jgi:S1-C subfamily serine protease